MWATLALALALGFARPQSASMISRLRDAYASSHPAEHQEHRAHSEGRRAEQEVADQLRANQAAFSESRVWQSVRVPNQGGGRREIDLVLLGPRGLHVVEIKRWGGAVEVGPDGCWTQRRRDGSLVHHGQVLETLQHKVDATLHHLRACGCELPPAASHGKVLLTGGIALPAALAAHPNVASSSDVGEYLRAFEESPLSNLARGYLPAALSGRQLGAQKLRQAAAIIDELGSWDVLTLHGGRVVTGDAHRLLPLDGSHERVPDLDTLRRQASELSFGHRRSLAVGAVGAVLGYGPSVRLTAVLRAGAPPLEPSTLPVGAWLEFRPAGGQSKHRFAINEVEHLVLSKAASRHH